MDNLSYLNQISSSNKPTSVKQKSPFASIFAGKNIRIFLIASAAIIILCIGFAIVNSIVNRETDYIPRLQTRATNISSVVKEYSINVKSSSLRAAGSSLTTILDNISSTLPTYISTDYQLPGSITSEEDVIRSTMSTSLYEAKINGLLDRTYARQVAYEINRLLTLEQEAIDHTSNSSAKVFLISSSENLRTILPAFADYSDTAQ